jgi:hypothetical protein
MPWRASCQVIVLLVGLCKTVGVRLPRFESWTCHAKSLVSAMISPGSDDIWSGPLDRWQPVPGRIRAGQRPARAPEPRLRTAPIPRAGRSEGSRPLGASQGRVCARLVPRRILILPLRGVVSPMNQNHGKARITPNRARLWGVDPRCGAGADQPVMRVVTLDWADVTRRRLRVGSGDASVTTASGEAQAFGLAPACSWCHYAGDRYDPLRFGGERDPPAARPVARGVDVSRGGLMRGSRAVGLLMGTMLVTPAITAVSAWAGPPSS